MTKKLYRHSDNDLLTVITKESDGEVFDVNSVSEAEYSLMKAVNGIPIVSKSIGTGGITKLEETNTLKIRLEDTEMDMSKGEYWHKLVIINLLGDRLPPVFFEQVTIE